MKSQLLTVRSTSVAALVLSFALCSCETVIDANLDTGPTQLSVEATLTDQLGPQTIRLTQTTAYFNNGTPPAATGATVTVADSTRTYEFTDLDNDGYYVWQPTPGDTVPLGRIGRTYGVRITYQGETYVARSTMNRVPVVDSLIFRKEKINPLSDTEGYEAEFFARDLPGATDYYRILYYRNSKVANEPDDIITLENASFSGSADTDGLTFIRPFRRSINPDSLYSLNDSVTVEIQSLTPEAFLFWQQFSQQISNGGLFAAPLANVPTNIFNVNRNGRPAVGFFLTTAIQRRTARVTAENIRP